MKNKKKNFKVRVRPKKMSQSRRNKIRRSRPLHKRVLLHPITFFLLLCVGVFLVGWTYRTYADSYTVGASILAPLPPSPAQISWPADQSHFTTTPITISGSCPSNTYVKLYRNDTFSGVASCGAGDTTFHIATDLSLGSNDLYARVFNITDNEGPGSSHITLWYDQTSIEPPAVPGVIPTILHTSGVEGIAYHSGSIPQVSLYPTLSGTAPPYSHIVITFHSNPIICGTYADSVGYWSCSLDQPLSEGMHEVFITATTPSGQILSLHSFRMMAMLTLAPLHHTQPPIQPFILSSDYHYQSYASGKPQSWNLNLNGGVRPYAVNVQWGDGHESTISRRDNSSFPITHSYVTAVTKMQTYTVKIQAVDTNNSTANLQMVALVRGNGLFTASLAVNNGSGNSFFSVAKRWIWLIWPSYLVVVLMAASFWLGERQEYINIATRKPRRRHV